MGGASQSDKDSTAAGGRLRLCLAASGGGHLRQLFDLQPVWKDHDYVFITEDTALGRSLTDDHRVHFVPHYGFGQVRLGAPLRMAMAAFRSFFQSAALIFKERPQVVITTGAGAVFFPVVWAKLCGARIVVIESFARFERPSLFGRMTKPIANDFIVQSKQLAEHYPEAKFFDPLKVLDTPVGPKEALLFATVGAILPFDRLVSAVAELKADGTIQDRVLIQTGEGGVRPQGMDVVETLPFGEVQALLKQASIVVCHGGTGSIITALREGCHVISMPRLSSLGEVYDDHQAEITEAFVKRGLVLSATTADELRTAIAATPQRKRVVATTEPQGLIAHLISILGREASRRRGRA